MPAGRPTLTVTLSCGVFAPSCPADLDLSTRPAAKPTASAYACGGHKIGASETCLHAAPQGGDWYVGVYVYGGSSGQSYLVRATYG